MAKGGTKSDHFYWFLLVFTGFQWQKVGLRVTIFSGFQPFLGVLRDLNGVKQREKLTDSKGETNICKEWN